MSHIKDCKDHRYLLKTFGLVYKIINKDKIVFLTFSNTNIKYSKQQCRLHQAICLLYMHDNGSMLLFLDKKIKSSIFPVCLSAF